MTDLDVQQIYRKTVAGKRTADGSFRKKTKKNGDEVYINEVTGLIRKLLTELSMKRDIEERQDKFDLLHERIIVIERGEVGELSRYLDHMEDGVLEFGEFYAESMDIPGALEPYIDKILSIEADKFVVHNGHVYGLVPTAIMPLAAENSLQEIEERNGNVRSFAVRQPIFGGMLDAHVYRMDGHTYYYTSIPGQGMNTTLKKAFYMVEMVGDDVEEDLSWLFDSICVTFVGVGDKYSKFPYLFKYLREWHPDLSV